MNEEQFEKKKKTYGYLASLPMIVAIVHFLGAILFQSTIQESNGVYANVFSLSMMFSSSTLVGELCSLNSLEMTKTISSVFTIIFGIAFVFLSSRAVKGRFYAMAVSLILYGFDTLCLVPAGILSLLNSTPLAYDLATFIVSGVLHVLFLLLLIYSETVAISLKKATLPNGE